MKVLMTGHKGFVGRNFLRLVDGYRWDITGIDIKDGIDCRDFFKKEDTQYDLVIHLAAIVGGRETIEGRPLAVADNFSIDSEFFQWCLKTEPKKVVYFSSSAAYPVEYQLEGLERKLSEHMQSQFNVKKPDMTYGWSKLIGEYLASFVKNVYVFRPFSGYGSDQDLTYPFPMYIQKALSSDKTFEVWGSGKQTRDFIHIEDIIWAVLSAVENNVRGPINLGWGRSTSFLELAQMCMDAAGVQKEIVTRPDKPVGCMHRVSDNSKMLKFYEPKITLEQGIDRALGQ